MDSCLAEKGEGNGSGELAVQLASLRWPLKENQLDELVVRGEERRRRRRRGGGERRGEREEGGERGGGRERRGGREEGGERDRKSYV